LIQGISTQGTDKENLTMIFAGLRHPDPEVVRAAATALQSYEVPVDQDLARLLLSRFTERRAIAEAMDPILAAAAKAGPQTFPDRGTRERRFGFWTNWYSTRFNQPFLPLTPGEEKSDEQVHALVLTYQKGQGNASNGLKTYERLQCNTCHGGGQTPGQEGRLFGPDLAGVVARLNRTELADALVYPSKQVADRFKAVEVQLKNGQSLSGFITERSADGVTLADIQQVHRLANTEISVIKPQSNSLMPERLLNRLAESELQDLLAFLGGPSKR
jgi:putative heme-binding domain-containing protein